jgi:hypothetical protein
MATRSVVHIDFDRVLETLRKGVRRADVFLGVGLNAAEHNPPISHLLSQDGMQKILLVKEELNESEKAHVAKEFGKWIRANGIRELLETFSIFMFELYSIMFLVRQHQKQLDRKFNKCRPQRFERMGIGDQVERIAEVVTVMESSVKIVRSLNKVRNCYAHRRGVVGSPDLDPGTDNLHVYWTALQIQVREPNGNVVSEGDKVGKRFENGGAVQLATTQRSKVFAAGSELMLEKHELKEICLCVLSIGQSLFNETVGLTKASGLLKVDADDSLVDPKPV